MSNRNLWTDAEDASLAMLVRQGNSATAIALILDRPRNLVIGRAHRKKLRFTSQQQREPVRNVKPAKPSEQPNKRVFVHVGNIAGKKESRQHYPEFKHATPAVSVTPLMVALMDLRETMCRFPIGDPRDEAFGFCGRAKEQGSYCGAHARICYSAPEMRRKAA